MPSDFHQQQAEVSANDKKINTESQEFLSSDRIRVGTKVVMNHAERQAYVKKSGLAKLFGVADLLAEVPEVPLELPEESSRLKRVRGLFKRGLVETQEQSSITEGDN